MRRNPAQFGFWRTWSILLLGGVAFALAGAFFATRDPDPGAERRERAEIESIARFAEASAKTAIESLRAEAMELRSGGGAVRPSGRIRAWAEVDGTGSSLGRVRREALDSSRSTRSEASVLDQSLNQALNQAIEQLRKSVPAEGASAAAIMVRGRSKRKGDAFWLAFPTEDRTTVFASIVPSEVFGSLQALSAPSSPIRAYVLSSDGMFLAHSYGSYVGSSVSELAPGIGNAAGDAVIATNSFDRLPVLAAVRPIGASSIRVGVERIDPHAEARASRMSARFLGVDLALWLVFAALLGWTTWVARQISRGSPAALASPRNRDIDPSRPMIEESARSADSPASAPREIAAAEATATTAAARGAGATAAGPAMMQVGERFVPGPSPSELGDVPEHAGFAEDDWKSGSARVERDAVERALRNARHDATLVERFEAEARRSKDPRSVARALVTAANELTRSPVLFLLSDPRTGRADLVADAGLAAESSPASLSFRIGPGVASKLAEADARGEAASLVDQPELARVLMGRLGVAHFEAWALAAPGPLGKLAAPKLLGVLVILQSGVDSFARRDSLTRMLRSTGRIYGNIELEAARFQRN